MKSLPQTYTHAHTLEIQRKRHSQGHTATIATQNSYLATQKRALDVAVAILLVTGVLSWLTPLLYILIRLDSKGPLFFVQQRTGRGGKVFNCYKFRTMRVNAECDEKQAVIKDARITRLGRFLRASHIDELPQLINVLLDDMSLVGPRPHMITHDEIFGDVVPGYSRRHDVKPGITGLAQAWGYHGPTPDYRSIANRTRLDLFYTQKASLGLDLRIMFRTVFVRSVNHLPIFRPSDEA